jgi:hypothetical protein
MKHHIISLIILFSTIFFLSACDDDRFLIKGSGSNVENSRQPGSFKGISLCMSATVEVHRDSVFRVELVGQQNILNVIETRVSGEELNISLESGTSIRKHNPITIRVYMPDITKVNVSGSGDVKYISDFNSRDLNTIVSGSGSITCRGSVSNRMSANISGSGSIRHSGTGTCSSADYTISGSGNIYAEWLKVDNVTARVSGSGDMWIDAERQLDATISGSGSIHYRGTPNKNISISGSGKVEAL